MNTAIFFSGSTSPFDAIRIQQICNNLNLALIFENDFTNLVQKIVKTNPKFVFLDGDVSEIIYLSGLLKGETCNKIKIIVISENFERVNAFVDVVGMDELEKYILNLKDFYNEDAIFDLTKVETQIKSFLLNLGFNAGSKGFDYIFECVFLLIENNQYKCLKECYQIIKCNYDIANENNIERDMRSAIQNAYEPNKEQWNNLFSNIFDKKPTCKNFIGLVANKIKAEQ